MQKKTNKVSPKDQSISVGERGKRGKGHRMADTTGSEITKGKSGKYKKIGKKVKANMEDCPFCLTELPIVVPQDLADKLWKEVHVVNGMKFYSYKRAYFWRGIRSKKCKYCGCRELKNACPNCKRDIWFNKLTGIYKHNLSFFGCGFQGQKLIRAIGKQIE